MKNKKIITKKDPEVRIRRNKYNAEKARERREYDKANGLCIVCHKPLDREGSYCRACADEINLTRKAYLDAGICPRCKKRRIYAGEKSCLLCREMRHQKYLKNRDSEVKRFRERYRKRKEQGLCTKCGKNPALEGQTLCAECRKKNQRYHRYKNGTRNVKAEWASQGKCVQCGADERVKDKLVCERCYRIKLANIKKCAENRPKDFNKVWKETNMKMRGRFRKSES